MFRIDIKEKGTTNKFVHKIKYDKTGKLFELVDAIYVNNLTDENSIYMTDDNHYCCLKDGILYCMNTSYDLFNDVRKTDTEIQSYIESGIDILTALELVDLL